MKRAMWAISFGLGFCLVSSPIWADGEFALQHRSTRMSRSADVAVTSSARQYLYPEPGRPSGLKDLPENVSGTISYFEGRLSEGKLFLVADSSGPGKLLKVYVDTDADGSLSDEKAVVGRSRGGEVSFRDISVNVPGAEEGKTVKVHLEAWTKGGKVEYLILSQGGYRTGKIQLAGETYRVTLVDSNFDGSYDGVFGSSVGTDYRAHDCFGMDLNNDGDFEYSKEAFPLPRMIRVKDTYFSLEVAPDGSAVRLAKATPEFGTLSVGISGLQLSLFSDSGYHQLTDGKDEWQLPAGKYAASYIKLDWTDEAGTKWTLAGLSGEVGEMERFEINSGETLSVKLGPPFSLMTSAQQGDGVVALEVFAEGRGGEKYVAGAQENGKPLPAPKFRIIDGAGKLLVSDSFQYG